MRTTESPSKNLTSSNKLCDGSGEHSVLTTGNSLPDAVATVPSNLVHLLVSHRVQLVSQSFNDR